MSERDDSQTNGEGEEEGGNVEAEGESGPETALVTGACGFVGERLIEMLEDEGYTVVASDLAEMYDGRFDDRAVEFRAADLTDEEEVGEAVEGVDVVFHTAALFSYSSLIPWEQFEHVNVEGTRVLCQAMVDADVDRLVLWSTSGVYAPPEPEEVPIRESHRRGGGGKYDRSKQMQEDVAMEYHREHGLGLVMLRPAPIYGPGSRYGIARLWKAIADGVMRVYPTEEGFKLPLVHVDDVCAAAVHLAEHGEDGEAYNVVDDQMYDIADVIRFVADVVGTRVLPVPVGSSTVSNLVHLQPVVAAGERVLDAVGVDAPFEGDDVHYLGGNYHLDNTKLLETGYELRYPSYRDGLGETLEAHREEGYL